ncbi:MAG TPA: bifunctional nicotinamidase/pyrazinamidase [Anaeromyxobacteraceae bacterium]|nr:bifunctional nicotinamidase/pyrazinamidase [Anaeromyxobacteraceae bacterium]
MRIDPVHDALLVVDLQHDFLPGGALAVPAGDSIVEPIARCVARFTTVVATQDWHPPGHVSFASAHPGAAPYTVKQLAQGPQELWPDHCVRGTQGAAIHPDLPQGAVTLVLRKGTRQQVDSYSAFRENAGPDGERPSTGLAGWLRERGIARVFVCGLAQDFCVAATAIDAAAAGFQTFVLEDLTRAVFPEKMAQTHARLEAAGVHLAHGCHLEE